MKQNVNNDVSKDLPIHTHTRTKQYLLFFIFVNLLVLVFIHASRYLSDKAGKSHDSTHATTSSLLESTSTILSSGDMKAPSLVFKASTGRRPKDEKYLREA